MNKRNYNKKTVRRKSKTASAKQFDWLDMLENEYDLLFKHAIKYSYIDALIMYINNKTYQAVLDIAISKGLNTKITPDHIAAFGKHFHDELCIAAHNGISPQFIKLICDLPIHHKEIEKNEENKENDRDTI
jgi:hypothetical protein